MPFKQWAARLPRVHLTIYLFYLAAAVLITWPLVTVFSTHFAGYPFGDAHEMTRHIWWFKYALQHGLPLIDQPLLGYPDGMPGVILWSDPLQFFPAWLLAFVMPLPAAYNLQALLNLALNGWAAYYLIWKLTDHRPAALLGGVIFLAAPTMQGHLAGGHGGLLVQWPLPLLALQLLAISGQPSAQNTRNLSIITRHLLLATLFFFLTPLGHTLQLIYAVMPLVGVISLTLIVQRKWIPLARVIGVSITGTILLALFLLPVFSATFGTSAYTDEGGGVTYSADLLSIVTPSFEHPIFGQWDYTHRVLGINNVEGSSYVGLVAAVLGVIAVWKNRAARWWLLVAVVAYWLSLGPLLKVFDAPIQAVVDGVETYITLPWAAVYHLPGFNLARTPGRFNFLLALAVAVLAGYGFSKFKVPTSEFRVQNHIDSQKPKLSIQYLILSILIMLTLFEYQSFWPLPTYSAAIPGAVGALAEREDVRAVFNLPWDNVLAAKDALWLQTAHEKPMIAGQVTRKTPVSPAKLNILQNTLDLGLLNGAGVDVVIVHKAYDATLTEQVRAKLGEPFYEDAQLALFEVPD
ncbi:MAG: hypothetical protein K8L97_33365 [Anaerolineae bacterium]|nr:hypothetical protein [Anaerolineae bacterium]